MWAIQLPVRGNCFVQGRLRDTNALDFPLPIACKLTGRTGRPLVVMPEWRTMQEVYQLSSGMQTRDL